VVAIAAILAVAAWLRARALDFGLPAVYNQDEVAILSRALAFAKGDLNPHNFLYPSFYFYVLFGWAGLRFAVARLTGAVPSLDAFQTAFFVDPTGVYLAGRWLSVACGVVTVAATWWLGRRLFGRAAGLAAALFLAVAPIAVRDAHYVKHDVPVTLAIVAAMIAMVGLVETSRTAGRVSAARLLLAGAACGVAFSTHYYSVFLALPLAWAAWLATRAAGDTRFLRALGVSAAATAVVFFALSPYLLLEWQTAFRDIVANRQIVVDRAADLGGTAILPSARTYLSMLGREGTGWPVLALAVFGAVMTLRRNWQMGVLLLLFPSAFLLFVSNTVAASRYLNPVLPFFALLAGAGVAWVAPGESGHLLGRWKIARAGRDPASAPLRGVTMHFAPRIRAVAAVAVCLLAAVPGARQSWRIGSFFAQPDTRTLARRFVESSVPPGSTVLMQPYSVQLHQSRESLVEALTANVGGPGNASTKFAIRLRLDPYPAPAYRTLYLGDGGLDADKIYVTYRDVQGEHALEALRSHGVDVAIWKRYDPPDPAARDLVTALDRDATRLASFSPYADGGTSTAGRPAPFLHNADTPVDPRLARPGPVIEVWGIAAR
jgi:hypothetical protein